MSRPLAVALLVLSVAAVIGGFSLLRRGEERSSVPLRPPPLAHRGTAAVNAADEPPARRTTPAAPVAPPGHAAVELLASGTSEPVSGLRVIFDREPFGPDAPTHRDTSDSGGRIALVGLPVGRWHARADDDYLFIHPQRGFVDVLPELDPWPTVLTVVRGALVEGSIVDRRGEPVAGASVRLRFERSPFMGDRQDSHRIAELFVQDGGGEIVAVTASDGLFAIGAIPAARGYTLETTHPRFPTPEVEHVDASPGGTIVVRPIVLGPGGDLQVSVRDPNGNPVAGAAIHVVRSLAAFHALKWPPASEPPAGTSDENGDASVRSLGAGRYNAFIITDGALPLAHSDVVIANEGVTRIDVVLEPGVDVSGVVLDSSGGPIAGAVVNVPRFPSLPHATTGADGRFVLRGLESDDLGLVATATGFAPRHVVVEDVAAEVRIGLAREATLSGQAVDASGKPVTEYRLAFGLADSRFLERVIGSASAIDVRDPEGRFRVTGLAPDTYRIRVDAGVRGLGSGESEDITLAEGDSRDGVRIEVAPTLRVRAHVVDAATSESLSGVRIEWTDRSPAKWIESDERIDWRSPRRRMKWTGEDGTVDTDVPLAAAALRFSATGHLASIVEPLPAPTGEMPGVAEFEVRLARGGTVKGIVRNESNGPERDAFVHVLRENGPRQAARTDASGEYVVSGLFPGEYLVGCKRSERATEFMEVAAAKIEGDATVRVDFGPGAARAGSRVFGRVHSSGVGVSGLEITLRRSDDDDLILNTRGGPEGEFQFPPVPAGDWVIDAGSRGGGVSTSVFVDGVSPCPVDLVYPSGGLVVTVLDAASGEPVWGYSVQASRVDGPPLVLSTTPDGRATFSGLLPGAVTVRVEGWTNWSHTNRTDYAPQLAEGTIPESGDLDLEFRLAVGAFLDVRVIGPDAAPVPDAKVDLHGGAADSSHYGASYPLGGGRTSVDGRYRIEGLSLGSYVAVVHAPGLPTTVIRGVRVDSSDPITAELEVPRGGTVSVRVVDKDGAIVRHSRVDCELSGPRGRLVFIDEFSSDGSGGCEPMLLAPGEYVFSTRIGGSRRRLVRDDDAENRVRASATVIGGDTTFVTLTLP